MKKEYGKLKTGIAKMIYRNMYKSDYEQTNDKVIKISSRTNKINKQALAIAMKKKE